MLSKYQLVRFSEEANLAGFDCGDEDLNDFILNDAKKYAAELLATTFLFIDSKNTNKVVAFFSVANDKINYQDGQKPFWNKLARRIPNHKRRKSYPAVLLARLGVSSDYQGHNIGSQIIIFLKGWFTIRNKTGCRFLLVDSYNCERVINFYSQNEFQCLKDDEGLETRSMYYDLMRSIPKN